MGTEDAPRAAVDGRLPVRVSEPAVEQMRDLPPEQAAAVARVFPRIRPGAGAELQIQPPALPGGHYLAIVPGHPVAPVVVYRELTEDEGGGYLVTALADRAGYAAYQRAQREGLTSTPLWRMLTSTTAATGADAGPAAGSQAAPPRPHRYKHPKPRSDRFSRRWIPRENER